MRLVGFAVELRVELAGNEERVFGQLDNLNQLAIGREAAKYEICLLKTLAVGVIEFVAVAVAFLHHKCAVQSRRLAPNH